ncbi:MAG: ATP phosphoribosyltransferase [Tissierellia bacterium]|nr:ATP phosphoribosyltransferase [Tissierellia bacterium]
MTLHIAIPKGRLGKQIIKALDHTSFQGIIDNDSRKLVFHDKKNDIIFSMVKNSDVTTYVTEQVFDIGFTGLDMIEERKPSLFLLDRYPIGVCKMCVARRKGDSSSIKRIATSFPEITKKFFGDRGQNIKIMKLAGSVELAPVLGLSDGIVDIVETGGTLRENGLEVTEDILDIYCCLVANQVSFRFKEKQIQSFMNELRKGIECFN